MCSTANEKAKCFEYTDSGLPKIPISFTLNGDHVEKNVDPTMTLLQLLHKEMKLFGT